MPVFDISDGQGNYAKWAGIEVFTRMYFPRGGEKYEQFRAWSLVGALAELPEDAYGGPLPKWLLQALVKAPSYEDVIVGIKSARQDAGSTAGSLLLFALRCKHHHPAYKPSLNKAWDVLSVAWTRAKKRASSVASLKKSWAEFKTVAHLWAAFDLLSPALSDSELTRADLPAFLAVADSLAQQAGEIVPQGQKKPLVSTSDLWMVPTDLVERSPSKRLETVPGPLPPDQLEILKVRRAHTRYSPTIRPR